MLSPLRAQDIHFSQFYENAILRNPALTGIFSGDYKAGVNYRTQWGSIANPFQTIMASAESRILLSEEHGDYLSYGLAVSYDHAGAIDFNSLQIFPALNYNKSLEDAHQTYLSVGFSGGYVQRSINYSKMTVDNQWIGGSFDQNASTRETITNPRISHWDLSAGLSLNSSIGEDNHINYYVGAAAWHVSKPKEAFNPNENFIRLTTKYVGSLGVQYRIDNNFAVVLHANYLNQLPYQETMVGGMLNWKYAGSATHAVPFGIYAGCYWRVKDAIVPTLKVDYDTYTFTMSYDQNTSSLKPASAGKGGWEFSIYVRGKLKHLAEARDQMKCPRFEEMQVPDEIK